MIGRLAALAALGGMGYAGWRVLGAQATPPRDLRGEVVVITGASAGIGRAAARAFAQAGASLVLVARRADKLDELAVELAAFDVQVLPCPADALSASERARVVEAALERFGRVDVLVNNAGLSMGGPLVEQDLQAITRMVDLNLTAVIHLTQLVLPGMIERGSGQIVNVSSVAGYVLGAGTSTYAGTKAGVNGFGEALRRDLRGTGVAVTTFAPGWVQTEMTEGIDPEDLRRAGIGGVLFPMYSAQAIGEAIVEATQRRRARVMMGGPGFRAGALTQTYSPEVMDAVQVVYRRLFSSLDDVTRTMG